MLSSEINYKKSSNELAATIVAQNCERIRTSGGCIIYAMRSIVQF